jgi:hypothetical protein
MSSVNEFRVRLFSLETYNNFKFFFDFLVLFGSFDVSAMFDVPNGESLIVLRLSASGVPGGVSNMMLGGRPSSPP